MNCTKCRGTGRYYRELFPGVTQVKSCSCEASETIRAVRKSKWDEERLINKRRIQEARERFGVVCGG